MSQVLCCELGIKPGWVRQSLAKRQMQLKTCHGGNRKALWDCREEGEGKMNGTELQKPGPEGTGSQFLSHLLA